MSALELALEHERRQHHHAVQALESTHVEAGVHEAQEMVQLRMELTASHEELDFLRARQVHTPPCPHAPSPALLITLADGLITSADGLITIADDILRDGPDDSRRGL